MGDADEKSLSSSSSLSDRPAATKTVVETVAAALRQTSQASTSTSRSNPLPSSMIAGVSATTMVPVGAAAVQVAGMPGGSISTTTVTTTTSSEVKPVVGSHTILSREYVTGGAYEAGTGEYIELNANSPHRVEETRRISSVVVSEQYLGEQPKQPEIRYVEVPTYEEVIKTVTKKEIREVEKRVPKYEIEWVEKLVEVPQIQYVDKCVEVPQIQEVIRRVPKIQVVDVPKEIIRNVPKIEVRQVERTVEVPGQIVEVPKPYTIHNKSVVHRFLDTDVPVVVAQTTQPRLVESNDVVDVDVVDYEPEVIPVDVHVIKPVQTCVHTSGEVVSEKHRLVTVPTAQYNTLLRQLNAHIEHESGLLPFIQEDNGMVAFLADQTQSRYVPVRAGAQLEGLEVALRHKAMSGKMAARGIAVTQEVQNQPILSSVVAQAPREARTYKQTPTIQATVTQNTYVQPPVAYVQPQAAYAQPGPIRAAVVEAVEKYEARQYSAPKMYTNTPATFTTGYTAGYTSGSNLIPTPLPQQSTFVQTVETVKPVIAMEAAIISQPKYTPTPAPFNSSTYTMQTKVSTPLLESRVVEPAVSTAISTVSNMVMSSVTNNAVPFETFTAGGIVYERIAVAPPITLIQPSRRTSATVASAVASVVGKSIVSHGHSHHSHNVSQPGSTVVSRVVEEAVVAREVENAITETSSYSSSEMPITGPTKGSACCGCGSRKTKQAPGEVFLVHNGTSSAYGSSIGQVQVVSTVAA